MFRTRRKPLFNTRRRSAYSSSYSQKRKPLKRWQIIASVPLAFLVLELLTRAAVGIAGKTDEIKAYNGRSLNSATYGLNFVDASGRAYDGLPRFGDLSVKATPLQGYTLFPSQKSDTWSINGQGFRASASLDLAKAENEMRIFVMGGSAAFGQGTSSNTETFTSQLQTKLNDQVVDQKNNPNNYRPAVLPYFADEAAKAKAKPAAIQAKQYRVVNAAVPGHVSSNQLSHLVHKVLPYKPDLIILLNGYDDLLLPSDQEAAQVPGLEELQDSAITHSSATVKQGIGNLLNRSFFLKSIRYWVLKPHEKTGIVLPPTFKASSLNLPSETSELEQRAKRFEDNLSKMAAVTSGANIPVIVAIQPEITSRIDYGITNDEQAILDKLGNSYPERIKTGYTQLRQGLDNVKNAYPGKVLPLTLTDLYYGEKESVFLDPIHISDAAHQKLADKLYGAVTSRLKVESIPFAAAKQ